MQPNSWKLTIIIHPSPSSLSSLSPLSVIIHQWKKSFLLRSRELHFWVDDEFPFPMVGYVIVSWRVSSQPLRSIDFFPHAFNHGGVIFSWRAVAHHILSNIMQFLIYIGGCWRNWFLLIRHGELHFENLVNRIECEFVYGWFIQDFQPNTFSDTTIIWQNLPRPNIP